MKKIIMGFCLFAGTAAFASNGYDLKMELSMNGKKVSSPRLIVVEGAKGSVTQDDGNGKTFIEVVATEGEFQHHKGILMNLVVGTIAKDGTKTILAKPQILAKENEPAQITVGEKDKETLSLSVLASRKTL